MIILKTNVSPIIFKSIGYNPTSITTFGDFWDIVPIDFLMTDLTTYLSTPSSFTFNLLENNFIFKSQSGFTLTLTNPINIIL